jgi:hypothetical protein
LSLAGRGFTTLYLSPELFLYLLFSRIHRAFPCQQRDIVTYRPEFDSLAVLYYIRSQIHRDTRINVSLMKFLSSRSREKTSFFTIYLSYFFIAFSYHILHYYEDEIGHVMQVICHTSARVLPHVSLLRLIRHEAKSCFLTNFIKHHRGGTSII